jgi:hypothetical protein
VLETYYWCLRASRKEEKATLGRQGEIDEVGESSIGLRKLRGGNIIVLTIFIAN